MKKTRQILALIGIILLVTLYILTIFAAVFDSTKTMTYLRASIAATVIIPVMIWVCGIFVRIQKNREEKNNLPKDDSSRENESAD